MNANWYQTQPMPQAQPPRRTPRWARKRFVLPALAFTGLIGIGIGGAGAAGETSQAAGAPESRATTTATATATVTATASAAPEAKPEARPTPTVTKTVKVPVRTTVTATAEAPADVPDAEPGTESGADEDASVSYGNCSEARAANAAPVHRGDPGYGRHLDRDGDGVGCDT